MQEPPTPPQGEESGFRVNDSNLVVVYRRKYLEAVDRVVMVEAAFEQIGVELRDARATIDALAAQVSTTNGTSEETVDA